MLQTDIRTPGRHRTWWREPMVWLIGGLPLTAVVAGIATVFIAFHKPDSLVVEGHIKQGMAVTETESIANVRASELGLRAELVVRDAQIGVVLKGSLDPLPSGLRLALIHPTLSDQDVTLLLAHADGSNYVGTLPAAVTGKRKYVLEPEDHAWRIVGEGMLSATGVMLVAKSSHSSTHP